MLYFQENTGLLWQHFKPKTQMQSVSKVRAMKSGVTSKVRLIRHLPASKPWYRTEVVKGGRAGKQGRKGRKRKTLGIPFVKLKRVVCLYTWGLQTKQSWEHKRVKQGCCYCTGNFGLGDKEEESSTDSQGLSEGVDGTSCDKITVLRATSPQVLRSSYHSS